MRLPLLLPEDIDYPTMVIKAGKQRIKRNLPFSKIKQQDQTSKASFEKKPEQ